MISERRLHYVLALLVSLLMPSFLTLVYAQPFHNSTSKLPTTWVNHPSFVFFDSENSPDAENLFHTATPILLSENNGTICGFYCHGGSSFPGSKSRDCLFGVIIFTKGRNYLPYGNIPIGHFNLQSPILVWSANRNDPVQENATLELSEDGDLMLRDWDGRLAWSSNTGGKSVAGMKLMNNGNLVLFDRNNELIWQSFDWNEVSDLLGSRPCHYPMVCGKYGVCSDSDQCGCLESRFFSQTNFRKPSLGCSLVRPISCHHSRYHTLLQLNNTFYFANFSSKEDTFEDDCKHRCLNNCSCKAALFARTAGMFKHAIKGRCLLLNEVFSIDNNEGGMESQYHTTLYVKVQHSYAKASRRRMVISLSSLSTILGVIFVMGCLVLFRQLNKKWKEAREDFLENVPGMPARYSYADLKAATGDFSEKLGEGGFGSVFEASLDKGTKVAVKCLDGIAKVKDSFLVEVKTIGSIHHVNLVKLLGFCYEKSHRLLIYEYMSNRSLDGWIFDGKGNTCLPWDIRKRIISDIAKGLAYLHEDCNQKIIHLDIKPQNILLDQNFNAKIGDFGLSKLIEKDQSRVITRMRGTPGYLAPEWLSSVITEKVDVYSFGVVVLEIICGRKNLDWSKADEDKHLLKVFMRKADEEKLEELVDENSEDMQKHVEEAVEMMMIAAWCLQGDYTKRPSMSVVVKVLEGLVAAETNLDYDFLNRTIVTKEPAYVATELPASALSGPR